MTRLAHTRLGPESPERTVLLLHGLLASGRNLRSFARGLVECSPGRGALLLDLPGHGQSARRPGVRAIESVAGAASAVIDTVRELGVAVDAVIGHSFGGKVAFEVGSRLEGVQQVWLLDSTPGVDEDWKNRAGVGDVLGALAKVRVPTAERGDVARQLRELGFSQRLADWMTTNLSRSDAGYGWIFDLAQIEALTDDYFRVDVLARLEAHEGPRVHFLRAERSERLGAEDEARLEALATNDALALHLLPDSGHWVHADNLPGLLEILCPLLSKERSGAG